MSFTYNGITSDSLGLNITQRDVYNAPAFDIAGIEVPAMSGDIIQSNERFKNKIVQYTGFIQATSWATLSAKVRDIMSLHAPDDNFREQYETDMDYRELTDTYDPGFTRMAYIDGDIKITPAQDRYFGATVVIKFNCQPFMYGSGWDTITTITSATVDDVGKYITVDKTYSLTIKEVGPTKTDGSTREVFVQPELRRLLDEYEIFRAENFTKTKVYFPGNVGGYLGYNAYNKYLRLTSQKAIGRVITPHALRHTSASLLIAQGVPLETVSRRLGHSDSHITKAIYLHLTEQLKKSDDEAIARTQLLP